MSDGGARVLATGESLRLVQAGNHAQGCIFQDGARFLTPELEARMDAISKEVTGFFIGRYDLRFASESELRDGRGFKIIELNGAAAEPTNIYDARTPLWMAYRGLFRQWELVFAIGAENRRRGSEPTPVRDFWRRWRQFSRDAATYPLAD